MKFIGEHEDYKFTNAKFKESEFREFIIRAPKFIHHIFAGFNDKSKEWYKLSENKFQVKSFKDIKILPNVLFTNESTLHVVLEFLYSDVRFYQLFITSLIQEYERTYIVGFFPTLIVLYQFLIKKPNEQLATEFLVNLFKKKQGLRQILLTSEIKREVRESVRSCLENDDSRDVLKELAKQMLKNSEFQSKCNQYLRASLTVNHLYINNEIYNWTDISQLQISPGHNDYSLDFVMEDISSHTVVSIPMKNGTEAGLMGFVLSAQLDLVHADHCQFVRQQYRPDSCTEHHWNIRKILRAQQPNRISIQILSDNDARGFFGDNFSIKFIPLHGNNGEHACVKILENKDNFEKFWQLCFKYQEWRHPHILKYFGLIINSCGFFRESANGPVVFDVYNNSTDFLFRHILDVLMSIGSALDYLHRNLNQIHGNVNLKSIVKVGDVFKLSESSISETNTEIVECMKTFNINLNESQDENKFRDLVGLLFSTMFMFFMNEDHYENKISEDTFRKTKCSEDLRILILDSMKNQLSAVTFLEKLYNIFMGFDDSILNEIVVKKKNKYIPEFLKCFSREAQMFMFNEIKFNQLTIEKKIGHGCFSDVFKATYLSNNIPIPVAVKKLKNTENVDLSKIKKELVPSLIEPHKNVLKSYGYSINNDEIYLISELGHSSLLDYLQNSPKDLYDEDRCVDYCLQICEGMKFLSDDKKFIHRDLAARNILVFLEPEDRVTLKISDFGLTLSLKHNKDYYKSSSSGHKFWLPSSDLSSGIFTPKTDIYSFGVLMWEIFSQGKQVKKHNKDNPLPQSIEKLTISDWAYDIMQSCWNFKEGKQPNNFKSLISLLKAHSR